MMRQINLLQKKKATVSETAIKKLLTKRILPLSVVYVVFFIVVISVSSFLQNQVTSLESEQVLLKQEAAKFAQTETVLQTLKKKTKDIDLIMANQFPFYKVLEYSTSKLISPGAKIRFIEVDENGEAVIDAIAANSETVANFTQNMISKAKKNNFSQVELTSGFLEDEDIQNYSIRFSFIVPSGF